VQQFSYCLQNFYQIMQNLPLKPLFWINLEAKLKFWAPTICLKIADVCQNSVKHLECLSKNWNFQASGQPTFFTH